MTSEQGEDRVFIDKVDILVQAGRGGNGVNSFCRDKFMRAKNNKKGKPDGGDGGNGGNVIVRVDTNAVSLLDFYYRKKFSAKRGLNGKGKDRRGQNGDDCYIYVPPGTLIKDAKDDCVLRDLKFDGDSLIAAKGGHGGKGNKRARIAGCGAEGETKKITLELKLIADIGLLGMPNAGKSTLLSKISRAKPKIASYPFTTKKPVLGIVKEEGFSFVAVDIPGLIYEAHRGKGLGFDFLRHIERTKILVHLVDMSERDPVNNYRTICKELELYSKKLLMKPQIIAANKMDIDTAKDNLRVFKKSVNKDVVAISAKEGLNLEELIDAIRKKL